MKIFEKHYWISTMKYLFGFLLIAVVMTDFLQAQDWAGLNKYKEENLKLPLPSPGENRIVFMGNSITEGWSQLSPDFFKDKPFINRGISGQTTPQMLLRFRADVINLKPYAVVILAGTNDIAGNTGPMTLEMIMDNIISMAELAKANNIKIILCSVLPAYDYPWKPGQYPNEKIPALNKMIKDFAAANNIIYLDYFSSMADERNGMKPEYSEDGVHPNLSGYKVMENLFEDTLKKYSLTQ